MWRSTCSVRIFAPSDSPLKKGEPVHCKESIPRPTWLPSYLLVFCLIWVFSLPALAQQPQRNPNTAKPKPSQSGGIEEIFPKRERDFRPSMLKLSYDAIPLGLTLFSEKKSGQGFQAIMDFDQFFLAAEYGTQSTQRGETYRYTNEGSYFSVGPEINFLKNATNGNALTFGLRYGQASFSDELSYAKSGGFFGDIMVTEGNPDLKARWMELTVSLAANVWKGLYLGYTVRYKVLRTVENIGVMAPYDVPGFGLYEDNTGVQFNFYVGWAIPLREKYPEEEALED